MAAVITTGLLLLILLISTTSQEVRHAAVSSNITFCFGQCEHGHRYNIIYESKLKFHFHCYSTTQIPDQFSGRESFNETSGCVTLSNISKSDAGRYQREHIDANGRKKILPEIEVKILDKVQIKELFRNSTDENVSLTVVCTGEPYSIIWTMDGGHLPDGCRLSDGNRTLTVPCKIPGTFMVNASNLVSAECKNITIKRETADEPQYKRPNRYYLLLLLIPALCILAYVLWKNRRPQMDREEQNGRPGRGVMYHANGSPEEHVSLDLSRGQESIPDTITNGDLLRHVEIDDAAVDQ